MFLFKIIRRLIVALFLVVIVVPLYFAGQIWWTAHHSSVRPSDAIVVLGAAQDNGKPTPILQERITEARLAYQSRLAPIIITVGAGQRGDRYTEAQASHNELMKEHIGSKALIAIGVGKDTLTSTIAYTTWMKLKGMHSVIIATDPYHCYRAMAEAKDLGISATCAPSRTGPGSLNSSGLRYIFRETGAYLAYETVGRFGIHLSDQIKK
jgi:vancomycin permeability regulator SanA